MLRFLTMMGVSLALCAAEAPPWPREFSTRPVKAAVTVDGDGNHIAATRHYRIISETPVSTPDLDRFATVVESVPQLLEGFPLPLWAPAPGPHFKIILCKDEASFQKLGGHAGAVGWYDGRRRQVLILSDYFLNPPSARPTRLQPRPNEDLLVHELVHLCMHGILWRVPPWFSEGTAEYFATCHKGKGRYSFHDVESAVRDHIRKTIGTGENGKVVLLPVATILPLDSKGWIDATQDGFNGNAFLPYATALLLAHYHFHGGAARRDRTAAYLETLHSLSPRQKAPGFPVEEKPAAIEAKLVKFWGPKGLNLVFAE